MKGDGSPLFHKSVMTAEVLEHLSPKPYGLHLELGVSTGGHLLEIAGRLGSGGFAAAVDLDSDAIAIAKARIKEAGIACKIEFIHGNYADLPVLLAPFGIEPGSFDTALLDAGMSGYQLAAGRGFSYADDSPLDMRFDATGGETAAEFLRDAGEDEIATVLEMYGYLRETAKVAGAICDFRMDKPIETAGDLVKAVSAIWPEKMPFGKRMRKLGQLFMAIREHVNEGAKGLRGGIENAIAFLNPDGGRLAVLTFSGGENLLVKDIARKYRISGEGNPDWVLKRISRGALKPSRDEVVVNPAAHSAMLRVYEKRRTGGMEE